MDMSLLTEAVAQEQRRIERMITGYETELARLPKGVLTTKSIKGNQYSYLQYRDGKRTISEYVGKDKEKIEKLQSQIRTMMKKQNITEKEALTALYGSELYRQLEREETKLWHLSVPTLYNLWLEEKETGEITYPEEG